MSQACRSDLWYNVAGNITEEVGSKEQVFLCARRFLGNSIVKQAANDCLSTAKCQLPVHFDRAVS